MSDTHLSVLSVALDKSLALEESCGSHSCLLCHPKIGMLLHVERIIDCLKYISAYLVAHAVSCLIFLIDVYII